MSVPVRGPRSVTRRGGRHRRPVFALTIVVALLGLLVMVGSQAQTPVLASAGPPAIRHVFVINLENKGYDETFGPDSPAPYLSRTLRRQGQLLTQYYGVAHNSLPNYLAQISGQGPDSQTQGDCQVYSQFTQVSTTSPRQAVGNGCVYPAGVRTIADQLQGHGLTWHGYLEDMHTPCRHPDLNRPDGTQKAQVGDQYAARHNPFVYFTSLTASPTCRTNDVPLSRLTRDLGTVATTPNLSYITPNLCDDGHDSPCVDGRPGGLVSADAWLRHWVPRILSSPAFEQDGLLVITFDEADTDDPGDTGSAAACCGEGPGPNAPLPGIYGPGGGRTGTLLLSPFVAAGTLNDTPYNHYGLLRTMENIFALPPLGYAAQARGFGEDVWGAAR